MQEKTLLQKLSYIQSKLEVPKSHKNTFGNYNYRNCEDILEAVKPLLLETVTTLYISDEIVEVGGRLYIKATVSFLSNNQDAINVTAYAREEETKKGMDGSQITGASSSYARKYALNGIFLIDDSRDADTQDNTTSNNTETQERVIRR